MSVKNNGCNVRVERLVRLVTFCKVVACVMMIIVFGLPFLVRGRRFSDNGSKLVVSLFFLTVATPNFYLGGVINLLGRHAGTCDLLSVTLKLLLV